MTIISMLLLLVLLLVLKGFFSGSEIAMVNSDKVKMSARANQGERGAKAVMHMFKNPDVVLGTTLVGTNIATVALTTMGTLLFIEWFGEGGDLYAFLVMTPLLLILGEIVPKSVYQQKSDQIATVAIYPLRVFAVIFYPVVFIFSRIARLAARLFGGKSEQNVFMTREQIRSVVDMSWRTSSVDSFDQNRIRRVIRFGETTVGEAMVPISDVIAIDRERNVLRAVAMVRRKGYNRLPVFKRNISNVIGVVTLSTWDLLDKDNLLEKSLADITQPAHYVLQFQTIDLLLPVLQQREDQMAIVVDEFGSAIGIITLEDIIEEVLGDIDVGIEFEEYLPRRKRTFEMVEEGVYIMDSRLPISEVNDVLDTTLNTKISHTIGGLVMAQLRRIPDEGEYIIDEGYRFTVIERSDKAIIKLRVQAA